MNEWGRKEGFKLEPLTLTIGPIDKSIVGMVMESQWLHAYRSRKMGGNIDNVVITPLPTHHHHHKNKTKDNKHSQFEREKKKGKY